MRSGPVGQVKSSMMALVWRCCTELVAESKQQLKEELGRRLSFGAAVKLILQYFAAVCCNCGVRLRSSSGVVHY